MSKLTMLLLLALVGCASDPVSSKPSNNPSVQVDLLFEHDGCKVYRFYDAMRYVYYANCGSQTQTSWQVSCGKGCIRNETVSTSEQR